MFREIVNITTGERTVVQMSPEEIAERMARPPGPNPRVIEIKARLAEIDAGSVRALRAKALGNGKPSDATKLQALEAEADALRTELAGL